MTRVVAVSKASSTGRGYASRPDSRAGSPGSSQREPTGVTVASRSSLVAGVVAVERHLEPVGGQRLGQALAPLDHGHGEVEVGVEVEVVELRGAAEPVGVDVHELRPVAERGMHPGDDERR